MRWQFLKTVPEKVRDHRVVAIAAGAAFYGMLALPPALAAGVALYGLFADATDIERLVGRLDGVLPSAVIDIVREQLQRLVTQQPRALSLAFLGSLVMSLWSANRASKVVIDALNLVYGERERRGFLRLNATSLVLTIGALLFALLAVALTVVVPALTRSAALEGAVDLAVAAGRWAVLLLAIWLALALLYRFAPDRTHPRWRWTTAGSAIAAVLWLVSSVLFAWYAAHFGTYDRTYGSLSAIVVLMIWLWLGMVAVLLGAEVDAEMERRRSTTLD